jgi:hypothetical protein
VTGLGEFSPIGQLFSLGNVLKIHFLATFVHGKSFVLILIKKRVWSHLGMIFFTNASGHPGAEKNLRKNIFLIFS